jgi:AcrR family transcriptional regulator
MYHRIVAREIAIDPAFADVIAGNRRDPRGPSSTADAIIRAAEHLFIEKGYHGTRVSEVARRADVSIGSIYVHFESKEGLYAALVERALEMEAKYIDAVFDDPDTPDIEKVISLGEAYLQFFREYPAYFRMLMVPHEDLPKEAIESVLARQVAARGFHQRDRLAGAIASCIEQGVIREDINPERAANFWWAAWNGVISLTMRSDQLALSEEEMEAVVIEGRLMIGEGIAASIARDDDGRIRKELRARLETMREEVVSSPTHA